jgi:hypothetical protein
MIGARFTVLLLLVVLQLAVVSSAAADALSYELQRRYDAQGKWSSVLGFTVDRSKLRIKVPAKSPEILSASEISALASATMLHYRVVAGAGSDKVAAAAVTSACSLVRGFEATKTQLTLPEVISVVLSVDGAVTGLQLSSKPSSACDRSVLTLFPSVTISTTLGALKPIEPRQAENNVAEASHFIHPSGFPLAASAIANKNQRTGAGANGDKEGGSGVDGPKEDNRTFFEKYQMYIYMFLAYSAINAFLAPKGKEGQEKGAAGK